MSKEAIDSFFGKLWPPIHETCCIAIEAFCLYQDTDSRDSSLLLLLQFNASPQWLKVRDRRI